MHRLQFITLFLQLLNQFAASVSTLQISKPLRVGRREIRSHVVGRAVDSLEAIQVVREKVFVRSIEILAHIDP